MIAKALAILKRLLQKRPAVIVQANFPCSLCPKVAASLELLLPENPQALSKTTTLRARGFIGEIRTVLSHQQEEQVKAALDQADALALYKVDHLFSPFYCADCARVYCRDHWKIEDVWDGQFYDFSSGYCPEDHKKMIDD
jgi:hypothetical protein